jgi:hypothetical protein
MSKLGNRSVSAARALGGKLLLATCVAIASAAACSQRAASPPVESRVGTTAQADMLGSAGSFLVLAASTVTNTGPTVIVGNLGLSPGTAITGFPPGLITGATDLADGPAGQAQIDLIGAWTTLKNEPCGVTLINPELGGATLTPGVYCFASPSAGLTGTLTLDARGNADAIFVFQIASTLTTASNSSVVLINGGSACNIFWEIGSSATLGTGTAFEGNILALTSITVTTGATITGRLLAHTGAVTLDDNTVRGCTDAADGGGGGGADAAGQDTSMGGVDAGQDTSMGGVDAGQDTSVGGPDAGQDTSIGGNDAGQDTSAGGNDAGPDTSADACQAEASACGAGGDLCAGSLSCCSGACVDLTSDTTNCGSCGNVCGPANCCLNASCQPLAP